MSKESKEIYEFGPYRLDISERRFERTDGSANGSLTEKAFQTLAVLVRNHGRLMAKSELLDAVWPDTAVEENNLDKSIHVIRTALHDNAAQPMYVETVHKHGYRFVADVKTLSPRFEEKVKSPPEASNSRTIVGDEEGAGDNSGVQWKLREPGTNITGRRRRFQVSIAVVMSVAGAVALGGWLIAGRFQDPAAPILSAPFAAEKLSTNGKVFLTTISPNGKLVVYSEINPGETQSLWLCNLETGYNTELIPAAAVVYFGVEFSRDGDWLYFVRRPQDQKVEMNELFRISIHGGIPKTIATDTLGHMSLSPDDSLVAFIRCRPADHCSLYVASAIDGTGERKLITRRRPQYLRDVDFSPDGQLIAFAAGQSENAPQDFRLYAYDLASGNERELTSETFFNITGVAWLPDQRSLLLTASRLAVEFGASRIWRVPVDAGQAEPLTNDTAGYLTIGLDRTAATLVTTTYVEDFRIRVMRWESPTETLVVPKAGLMSFDPYGRMFFTSSSEANPEIWSINADGTGRRQLTVNKAVDERPVVAPDGKTVFFCSNRSGSTHVWRMTADGMDQRQITHIAGGFPISVSSESEWVFFHHGTDRTLWKVSTSTSEERIVLDKRKTMFAVSPDGTQVAYREKIGPEEFVVIASTVNGKKIDQLKIADQKALVQQIQWLPDASGVAYVTASNDFRNNTVWYHTFAGRDRPKRILDFDEQLNEGGGFAVSPDGKTFAISHGDWRHNAVLVKGLK